MEPDGPGGHDSPPDLPGPVPVPGVEATASSAAAAWQPGLPPIREHLPSVLFGGVLPIGVYFIARTHVGGDTPALILAGAVSATWILVAFVRRRTVDVIGVAVLLGFAAGVTTSLLFGGNDYMLKVRDGFFTLLFGVACIVTLYTSDRPAFFYVSRYFSAGNDPAKVSVFDRLHDAPLGRHTFRTLSVVWGVGLVVDATSRLSLAEMLPTGTFIAVSPFITGSVLGSLVVFTVVYTRQTGLWSLSGGGGPAPDSLPGDAGGAAPPDPPDY
jgi:hypothetical protein